MKVTIIRGLPGSGKTTFALKKVEVTGAVLIESDQFRTRDGGYVFNGAETNAINNATMKMARIYAQFGADIIFTGVFAKCDTISRILKTLKAYKPSGETLHAEIIRVVGDHPNRHRVPQRVIDEFEAGYEPWSGETFVFTDNEGEV